MIAKDFFFFCNYSNQDKSKSCSDQQLLKITQLKTQLNSKMFSQLRIYPRFAVFDELTIKYKIAPKNISISSSVFLVYVQFVSDI